MSSIEQISERVEAAAKKLRQNEFDLAVDSLISVLHEAQTNSNALAFVGVCHALIAERHFSVGSVRYALFLFFCSRVSELNCLTVMQL